MNKLEGLGPFLLFEYVFSPWIHFDVRYMDMLVYVRFPTQLDTIV